MHVAPVPAASRSALWQARWRAARSRLAGESHEPVVREAVRVALGQGFVLTRHQVRGLGVPDAVVRRLVRRGTWRAIAYGVVSVLGADAWDGDDIDLYESRRREHVLECAAAALVRPDHVVCARSAAILHGLPVRRTPDEPVVTARDDVTQGSHGGTLVRGATLRPFDEMTWFGLPLTTPERTAVDLARHDRRDGIMAADAALRENLTTRDALRATVARCAGWPGVTSARLVVDLADALSESPLESAVRLALHESQLPPPELQVGVVDPVSGRRYRVDFAWLRSRVVLEADGRVKYTADELWEEKQRELGLTRAGYRIERVVWSDLGHAWPAAAARIRRALTTSPTS
ncbi:MAG: hypothetical protein QOG80_3574 [Pseudonocardiales bacterium]|nr:hypothetical protein [Pseudonocardiales bacterium]